MIVDVSSGLIAVVGHAILVELNCCITPDPYPENSSTADTQLKYDYKLVTSTKPVSIYPDVSLKPWSGNVNGRYISIVVRVPDGENPPEKSWSAICRCLFLGKTRLRALVLFLGESFPEPGA